MQTQIQRRVGDLLVTSGIKQNQDQVNQTVGRPDHRSSVRSSSPFGQRQQRNASSSSKNQPCSQCDLSQVLAKLMTRLVFVE